MRGNLEKHRRPQTTSALRWIGAGGGPLRAATPLATGLSLPAGMPMISVIERLRTLGARGPGPLGLMALHAVIALASVACTGDDTATPPTSGGHPTMTTTTTTGVDSPVCHEPSAPGPELRTFGEGAGPEVAWATAVGDIDADADEIDGIAVDDRGNTAISGVFRGRVDIGEVVLDTRGEGDIFVASLHPDGTVRWVEHFGGAGDDNTYDLDVDGEGNVYLSGWFSGTVDLGGIELTAAGGTDMFVAKVSVDGTMLWARAFGGLAGDGGNEIEVTAEGEVAVSAITAGDFEVDGVNHRFGGGLRDSLVVRMDADGGVRWVHHFHGAGNERIRAIALGASGHVAVGFQYRSELRSGTTAMNSRGDWDGALARLTPTGDLDWILTVGGAGTDNVRGAGIAPDSSIYASGQMTDEVFLLDRDLQVDTNGDDFVARVTPSGVVEWVVTFGGPGRGVGAELHADDAGVVVSALLDGPITVRRDLEEVTQLAAPTDLPTSYAAAFGPDGELRFVYAPSTRPPGGGAFGDVIGVSPNGRYLAQALRFRGTLSVGGDLLTTPADSDSAVIFTCLHDS